MESKNPSVAVIILSWNDWKNTKELIESVLKSDYKNYDIIIVDNNSNVEHFEKLLNWCVNQKIRVNRINFKPKTSIKKKISKNLYIHRITEIADVSFAKNLGVARGINKGFNFALKNKYDFIVTLDCDFLITKNFISGMIKTFRENVDAVSVSPKVYYYLNKKTKIIWWKGLNFTRNYFRFQRTGQGSDRRSVDKGQLKGIIATDAVCGPCAMYKSKIIRKAGKHDEDFFFGPADIEISHRLKKYGKHLVNLNYYNYHKVSQSVFVSGVKSRIYHETIGWLLLTKKVASTTDIAICYIFFILRAFKHLLKFFYKKDKDRHVGYILGIKDYFLKY